MTIDWTLIDAAGAAALAGAGVYAAIPLARSYLKDWTSRWDRNRGMRLTMQQEAENLRKLGSLLPWPIGALAIAGAALSAAAAFRKLLIALGWLPPATG